MTEDVLIRSEGAAGRITLNRPKALNALNFAMTEAITAALSEWRNDERIKHVIIEGAGGRAFCAGGDIRALYDVIPTDPDYPRAYWRAEYRLNAMIARYEKPYVAVMDGFCLGGGVGLSAHGSHRIVTERSMVGMPETAIGFTPDVGGSWLLARAPGHAGEYMAATAYRMNAADAIHAGFADTAIPADDIPAFVAALVEGRDAGQTAQRFAIDPGNSDLAARRADIDLVFGTETIQEAVRRLEAKQRSMGGSDTQENPGPFADGARRGALFRPQGARARQGGGKPRSRIPLCPSRRRSARLPRRSPGAARRQGRPAAMASGRARRCAFRRCRGAVRAARQE